MTRQLFLFEARRLARHPLVWGASALVLALQTYLSRGQQPHWGVDPVHATGLSTCLAAAVLIVAALAVSRDGRHGMPETLAGLPGRAGHRTRAILLATPLVAGLASAVAVGGYLLVRLAAGPAAGRLDVWEPLTAVAAAMLAATLGVAIGRWVRRLIAGPMVVAVLGYLIYMNPVNGPLRWLLPVMQDHHADWPDRPSGTHLVYVLALVVVFAGVALLRHRTRLMPAAAVVAALAVAVPAGAATAAEPPVLRPRVGMLGPETVDPRVFERYFGPAAHRCSDRQGVTYCAYPGYEPWIPLWEQAVLPAADVLPAALRARLPRVEQTPLTWYYGHDGASPFQAPMTWGHPDQRAMLAQSVGLWATGLLKALALAGTGGDAHGQARMVLALWITGQVSVPEPPRPLYADVRFGRQMMVGWGPAEVAYAKLMLATPGVRDKVSAHWDTLTHPATTIDQALPLLGLNRTQATPPGPTPCR
ncbi:hypothetical protein [Nonomuraea sp. SBT364]|uniref:hypothetical protein n=1 Tax=Nonomuraea sp. SBT364 TaxID=1580530 RepID=UPI00066ABA6C|nr:hypothetical protein [Nonomuraea sp. SBT364]